MPRALCTSTLVSIAALACVGAPASAATTAHCGQQITRDTRLANELVNCAGSGLTVVADGVTLDLGGHVVDGTNAPAATANRAFGNGLSPQCVGVSCA